MLTYALDEYGDFEGLKKVKEPIYIAGLIFDDYGIEEEEKTERRRVKAYYETIIAEAAETVEDEQYLSQFVYPSALHARGDKLRNHYVVGPVKRLISETLPEFIRRGTYKGRRLQYKDNDQILHDFQDRKGKYYVFVILKSDQGMEKLLGENASILVRDDYASNLYFHMADTLVSRLIFYNPLIPKIDEISLDIATRRSAPMKRQDELFKEYKDLGYKAERVNDTDDMYQFRLTNADLYRSVIAKEVLNADRTNLAIRNFHVCSINYSTKGAAEMEFLYLADSVCSTIGFKVEGESADDWLSVIRDRVWKITGNEEDLIFGYDEIDNVYSKAYMKYLDGDYYNALGISFDARNHVGVFSDYYNDVWFIRMEDRIQKSKNVPDFNIAVRKLHEALMNNNVNTDKCFYIYDVLEKMADPIKTLFNSREANKILYTLYDIGVTVNCHIGNPYAAEECFRKCRDYSSYAGIEENLNTRNKLVVLYCDSFMYKNAEKLSEENILYQKDLMKLKDSLGSAKEYRVFEEGNEESLGKAHSQLAQVHAFERNPEAEKEFKYALSRFARGSANYKITQSYLLHHMLDTNKKELRYLSESKTYFGRYQDLTDQLDYIIEEGSKKDPLINVKYALYVFLRGLYQYRLSELDDEVWFKLQNFEKIFGEVIQDENWTLTGHPSELIFKYLRLIALSRGEDDAEEKYMKKMDSCLIYFGDIEEVIRDFAEIEIMNVKGNIEERDRWTWNLCEMITEQFKVFANFEIPEDGEERYQWLDEHITFMYR